MIDDPDDAIPNKLGSSDPAEYANSSPNPADHVIGEAPMTQAQAELLRALCADSGVEFDAGLSQAGAAERIAQLREDDPNLPKQAPIPGA